MKYNKFLALAFLCAIILPTINAAHVITTSSGGDSFSANQSTQYIYNISVTNSDTGAAANITQVNITIPSVFTFTAGTQSTNISLGSTFENTSTVLSWTNSTLFLLNGSSIGYFWFNASVEVPGTYNITVTTVNATGSYSSNLTATINDTSNPTASFGTNTIEALNSSTGTITLDLKCTDNSAIDTIELWGNWSGSWALNQTNSSPINNSFWNVSISLSEGRYIWGVYCNDTDGNSDWTATNRTLTIDTTNPAASASCTSSSVYRGSALTCSCSGTDATSGVYSSSASSSPDTYTPGTYSYTCTVTDFAGNSAGNAFSYTVLGGGSSSTYSKETFWTEGTFAVSENQFKESFSKNLAEQQRLKINFDGEYHYVGVVELTATSATINVSSEPQQTVISIGQSEKFDITNDNNYDLIVTLNSIKNNEANITIKQIIEPVPEDKQISDTEITTDKEEPTSTEEVPSSRKGWKIVIVIIILIVVSLIISQKRKIRKVINERIRKSSSRLK